MDERVKLIQYALIVTDDSRNDEIRAYFRENKDVKLTYSMERVLGIEEAYVKLNDIDARITLRSMSEKLRNWLSPYNDLYISACSEVFYDISWLRELNVGLVDFSDIAINSEDKTTILANSEVRELKLPTFKGDILKLSDILVDVKVEKELEVGSAFKQAKILRVDSLFPRCEFSTLDLSNLKLTDVVVLDYLLSNLKAEVLILPKDLGSRRHVLSFKAFFSRSTIKEIKGLEEFPWHKAVCTSEMFLGFKKGKIVIEDSLNTVLSANFMFYMIENVEVEMPEVKSLPGIPNWFSDPRNCKIHIPKFMHDEDGIVESFRKLDDTNEIFCNEAFAKKLML